ncbi:hypothetical protein [Leptotrichia sp. OH3620_COT-345]|uniref:hypothetical protein n=1 Tax=Leptotrichia sp. OH3620_COT-345 TaxID=2491048 RepID=UPI0011D01B95|nr:hypothetical protein [Leptotrichia sp. OH3620_COT-345]
MSFISPFLFLIYGIIEIKGFVLIPYYIVLIGYMLIFKIFGADLREIMFNIFSLFLVFGFKTYIKIIQGAILVSIIFYYLKKGKKKELKKYIISALISIFSYLLAMIVLIVLLWN